MPAAGYTDNKRRTKVEAIMVDDDLFVRLRYQKDLDRIEAVRKSGTSVTDRDGNTLLHEAAVLNDCSLAQFLIGAGVSHAINNEQGSSPLHVAVANLNLAVAALLLEAGANSNAFDGKGMSPLLLAISAGAQGDMVRLLLKFGADPALAGPHGFSPVMLATKRNDKGMMNLLSGE